MNTTAEDNPLKLTVRQFEASRTPRGGFTRKQLAAWGVAWPPPKGWKKALLKGQPIPSQKKPKQPRRATSTRIDPLTREYRAVMGPANRAGS